MKKLLSLCLFTTISCFANYICDPCNPCMPKDPCDGCRTCDPCAQPCPKIQKTPKPNVCAYNAPYKVEVICPWDSFVTASYLFWEAKMDNTQYGDIEVEYVNLLQTDYKDMTVQNSRLDVDNKYQSGFKVGAGFTDNCDNWDFLAEYTFHRSSVKGSKSVANSAYSNDGSNTVSKFINGYFFTVLESEYNNFQQDMNFYPFYASGKWDVDLDMGDLEVGREYYVGRNLLFRPFSSLRLTWLRQTYLAKYDGPVSESINDAFNNPIETNGSFTSANTSSVRSWAIGPRFGFDLTWLFCGNFKAFSDMSTSILYTDYYKISTQGDYNLYNKNGDLFEHAVSTEEENKDLCALRPQAELTLGFSWGCNWDCNRWFFDISAGYTFIVFWNQNMFYDFNQQYNRNYQGDIGTVMEKTNKVLNFKGGDLYYHGLVITGSLYF